MEKFSKFEKKVIEAAYENEKIRDIVYPLIIDASMEEDWGDKEVEKPSTGNKVQLKNLLKSKDEEDQEEAENWREKYKSNLV